MPEIVCIRFKPCGKLYDFEAGESALKPGDMVVVESDLGLSIGKVVRMTPAAENKEYKKVLRLASEGDLLESKANSGIEKEAFDFCRERIMARGLQMKLIRTEATLDRKRIIFYFISEKRIDFRELVKDLAQKFRTRIEMRQVGVRDEAKMTGGLGLCGRQLCCASFLSNFAPISIKMAKKQELVLNTGKLSGICGRLMCCLSYEYGNKTDEKRERQEAIGAEETIGETSPADAKTCECPCKSRAERTPSGPEKRELAPGGKNKTGKERFERRPRPNRPQPPAIPQTPQRPQRQKPGTEVSQPREQQDLTPQTQGPQASDPSQNDQNQKRKKKRRWRKRGHKGGAPQTPGAPKDPGASGD